MGKYGPQMTPDRFELKDLKRRMASAERHIERLEGLMRSYKNLLKAHLKEPWFSAHPPSPDNDEVNE